MHKIGAVLLCLALPAAAPAQELISQLEGQYFGDFPVVLSASRLVQPVNEAPAAVTVIDRDTIRSLGAREIAELFRLVPGFVVGYRDSHAPIVTYQGLSDGYARRLQVMIDGISVYSPLFGGVEWNELPISVDDIERIEVVRGPNGASFGANAFSGMINIITRQPVGRSTSLSVTSGDADIGDWGVQRNDHGDDWRYRLSAGVRSDRGLTDRPAAAVPDGRETRFLNARIHYQLSRVDELMASYSYSGGHEHEGSVASPRLMPFENHAAYLRWTRSFGHDSEYWIQVGHAVKRDRPVGNPAGNYDLQRDEIEFQHTTGLSPTVRTVWGAQWREDMARSAMIGNGQQAASMTRLFGTVEWAPLNKLWLHAGAMHERHSLSGSSLSPRLSATYTVVPGHSVRIGASKTVRNPTILEEFALTTGFPPYRSSGNLKDERVLGREVAYLANPSASLTTELRWFSEQIRDLIYVYVNWAGPNIDFRNLDQASIRGAEFSFQWKPWDGTAIRGVGARTIVRSTDIDATYSRTAPRHSASLVIQQQLPWNADMSIGYYRVGALTMFGGGDPMPAYDRVDLRLARKFRWGAHQAELSLVTQNLFGHRYPDFDRDNRNKTVSWLNMRMEF